MPAKLQSIFIIFKAIRKYFCVKINKKLKIPTNLSKCCSIIKKF